MVRLKNYLLSDLTDDAYMSLLSNISAASYGAVLVTDVDT